MVAPASSPPLPPISTLFSLARPNNRPAQTPSTPSPLPSFEAAFSSINVMPSPSTSPSSPPAWIGAPIRRPDSARLEPRIAAIRARPPPSAPASPASLSSAASTAGSASWPVSSLPPVSRAVPASPSTSSSPRRAARSPASAPAPATAAPGPNTDRYSCPTCHKSFSRPSSLRIHSHSHTGEKPFKCSHLGCGKAFSVRSNMKRHERGCHAGAANAAAAAQAAHAAATAHSEQQHQHVYSHMPQHGYLRLSA